MIMEENKNLLVQSLLYDCSKDEIKDIISKTKDSDILYMYAYNYNWDDGFEIPQLILDHSNCNLSIALLIFYNADGVSYLYNKSCSEGVDQWFSFVKCLYNSIINEKYQQTKIEFKVPLSKVELYKLKKVLKEQEKIFIENIEGENLNIDL